MNATAQHATIFQMLPAAAVELRDRKQLQHTAKITAKQPSVWFLYIARCADGSLYTGITTDVPRRIEQHNAGTASRYTRSRRPVRIEYHEPHVSRSAASKRESAVKAMTRRAKEAMIRMKGLSGMRQSGSLGSQRMV